MPAPISLGNLWQDARYALRMLRRTPGFTAVAVLSLALGIGANTAIFSLINTLMLRMLPVPNPGQLVELLQKYPGEPRGNGFWTPQSYEYFRDHNHVFSSLIATSPPGQFRVGAGSQEPETASGQSVVGDFFSDLGVKPAIGRLLRAEDNHSSSRDVAVVSWSYWKTRFNLDPAILGKSVSVQDLPVTIVGVASPEFFGLQAGSRTDIWLPMPAAAHPGLVLIGRLKPGVSIVQARADMAVLYRFTIEERSRNSKDPLLGQLKIEIEPAGAGLSLLRDHFSKPLFVLMALVALLLLIACANVAGLLLARGAARQKELAIRISMGAGRIRLIRQALTESLLLSGAGAILGVLLAYFGAGALVRMIISGRQIIGLPRGFDIDVKPDLHVLFFTAAVALLCGVLFGLAPAFRAFSSVAATSLREVGRAGETRFGRLFGKCMVILQVTFSVALLSSAGLFIRNLSDLERLNLGFNRDNVLLVTLDPSRSGYTNERLSSTYKQLLDRLASIPGVRTASLSAPTPLSGAGASGFATVEGREIRPEDRRYISIGWVGPKFFETLGTPFLAGRDFNLHDEARPRVAIINQAMALHYFAGSNPLGKQITLDHVTGEEGQRSYQVIGLVGDAKYYEIRETAGSTIYLPAFQAGTVLAHSFVLRTNVHPAVIVGDVRRTLRAALAGVSVARITTLSDQIEATIVTERIIGSLSALFGALGSLLAAVGLYGLLAYTVARRTTEIGVRMALGATAGHVIRMVFGDAFGMVGVGLVLGIPLAMFGNTIAANLQDLPPNSAFPITFGTLAMISLALLAAHMPARRAARLDPMQALRHE